MADAKTQPPQLQPTQEKPAPQQTPDGIRLLNEKETWAITPQPFIQDDSHDLGRTRKQRVGYLEGLR